MSKSCECGCGLNPNPGRRFVNGHQNVGRFPNPSTRRKLGIARLGNQNAVGTILSPHALKDRGLRIQAGWAVVPSYELSDEAKRSIGQANSIHLLGNQWNLGRTHTVETRTRVGEASRQHWQSPEYREKVVRAALAGTYQRPTEPEARVLDIIGDYGLPYEYNGNGSNCIVGTKVPDFIGKEARVVIEVFGDYWHSEKFDKPTEDELVNYYRSLSYHCLILWESELTNYSDDFIAFLLIDAYRHANAELAGNESSRASVETLHGTPILVG